MARPGPLDRRLNIILNIIGSEKEELMRIFKTVLKQKTQEKEQDLNETILRSGLRN
jgi:hypothetical protein